MKLKIKICGMRDPINILKVSELEPDIMGFIFYRFSQRYAGDIIDERVLSQVSSTITKAGVFVNENEEMILTTVKRYSLNMVQLHGDEPPSLCQNLKEKGITVIKAFSMEREKPFIRCSEYSSSADYYLFDAPGTGSGGSGKQFNWNMLGDYSTGRPFFLSGGISPDDIDKIREIKNPLLFGIDINSRFEIMPGIKDTELLRNFIAAIRQTY